MAQIHRTLEIILKDVGQVANVVNSRRKQDRLYAQLQRAAHAATLRHCIDELDWAMKSFEVRTELITAGSSN